MSEGSAGTASSGVESFAFSLVVSFIVLAAGIIVIMMFLLMCWTRYGTCKCSTCKRRGQEKEGSVLPHIIRDKATLKHALSVIPEYFEDEKSFRNKELTIV